jgi:hypothetical protein
VKATTTAVAAIEYLCTHVSVPPSPLSSPQQAPKLFEEPAVHPSAVVSERCLVSRMFSTRLHASQEHQSLLISSYPAAAKFPAFGVLVCLYISTPD